MKSSETPLVSDLNQATLLKSSILSDYSKSNHPVTIAVGSGKGGVGKTIFSVNLGYRLARLGKTVTIIDMDFGSPELHMVFNICPKKTLIDCLLDPGINIRTLINKTRFKNLNVICGSSNSLGLLENSTKIVDTIFKNLKAFKTDFIIFDLGTGLNPNDIQLFNKADKSILIGTPEPAVILENFNFLKICVLKKLGNIFKNDPKKLKLIKDAYSEPDSRNSIRIKSLLETYTRTSGKKHNSESLNFFPNFVLNMVRDESDNPYALTLEIALRDLFNLELNQLGSIEYSSCFRGFLKTPDSIFDKVLNDSEGAAVLHDNIFNKLLSVTDNNTIDDSFKKFGKKRMTHLSGYSKSQLICSAQCNLWGHCSHQRGGYPCKIKYIGFMNSN